MSSSISKTGNRGPWNKGRLIGQKLPLKLREIWAIRVRLQLSGHLRDLALFNLAIDSKLRGCDLVSLRAKDIAQGRSIFHRAIVMQRKTGRPVQFEITEQTRQSVLARMDRRQLAGRVFVSQPSERFATLFDPSIRTHRDQLGGVDRVGRDRVRHTFDASNKSDVDLPADEKPPSCPKEIGFE